MANFNRVILMGTITSKDYRISEAGRAQLVFRLAVEDKYRNKEGEDVTDTEVVTVSAHGHQAEVINAHLDEGSPILVEGRLRQGAVSLHRFHFVPGGKRVGR